MCRSMFFFFFQKQAEPPNDVRAGSKEYYKKLYEAQLEISRKEAELPVTPEDLGIVNVPKIQRVRKKITRVTGPWQYGRKEDLRTYRGITRGGRGITRGGKKETMQ